MRIADYLMRTATVCALTLGGIAPAGHAADEVQSGTPADLVSALSDFPQFANVPSSVGRDAPVVLHGLVEQIGGTAMARAQVLLSAWPTNDEVRRMPKGATVTLTPMARTTVDDTGAYDLRAPVTPLLRSLAGPDGIDIELDVFHADRHYTYLSQVIPTADGKWLRNLTGLTGTVTTTVDKTANLLNLTLDRTVSSAEQGLNLTQPSPVALTYRHPAAPGCTNFEKVGTNDAWETIATAVARPGVTAVVKYDESARTESSTGASIGGGTFSVNGSRTRTMGFHGEFRDRYAGPGQLVNEEYQLLVQHGVFRRACARDFRGDEDVLYITEPLGLDGGGQPVPSRFPLFGCRPGDGRTVKADLVKVGTTHAEAATYSEAFSFAPTAGSNFTGSALSGYDKSVAVDFRFDPTGVGWWCGNTGLPVAPGQRVQGFEER